MKRKIKYLFLIFLLLPAISQAAMQSNSYVIYESVMHVFDGPVISGVSASVSAQTTTVVWTTDQISDSFVEYDANSDFSASKEQGTSVKNAVSHSVALSGLAAATTYYYRVKSQRVNGGISINTPSSNTFTTEAETSGDEEEAPASGGGGILIIDKTDKIPPVITELNIEVINDSEVEINWQTDEEATSFTEYGVDINYGAAYGYWGTSTFHTVRLKNLKPETEYHLRSLSSDSWGNVGYSEDIIFSTLAGIINEEGEGFDETIAEDDEPGFLESTTLTVLDFFGRIFPEVSLNELSSNPLADINSLEDLHNLAPTPILSGEPRVQVGADNATIFWTTDIEAGSQVAFSDEENYRASTDEPYSQVVGDTENLSTDHEITLRNLSPNTVYHFQLRSKPRIGAVARSRDFTFQTSIEELAITSFFSQIIDDQTAVFKWVTNKESDSAVSFAPYHGGDLAIDLTKTVKDNVNSVIHEVTISEFVGGTVYSVSLISNDKEGNRASETLNNFSTAEDDAPPHLTRIKADSTVFLDRNNKTQTIISWLTNEPATSKIYYQEGVHSMNTELKESTELNTNYTKEHVIVITKFKPGIVYTFRVESTDSGENKVLSKPHTFMTAKKKESIFQIIMNILENTFGWMKGIM
ncbi:fibronectin type III domain-containing protein [Candidatus Parcubacteria bacterium]|nr:fibronectin type III domain-containing protein [Candidatus Parcubacteria bacterium]